MNDFVQELVRRIDNRFAVDSSDMSMGDWICANTSLRGKPFDFKRYPFQKAIADDMHPNLDVVKPSQVGLALALDTPVITPTGWTTMGELLPGDTVYTELGQPTKVLWVSPIYLDHSCYVVEFDTGEKIVADAQHRWFVQCDKAFNEQGLYPHSGRVPISSDYKREGILTTQTLANITHPTRNLFAIPNTQPLSGTDTNLPVDPYFLGLWLGDGSSHHPTLTAHEDDSFVLQQILTERGLVCELKTQIGPNHSFSVNPARDKNLCPRGHDKGVVGTYGEWNRCSECVKQEGAFYHKQTPRDVSTPLDTMHRRLTELGVLKNKHLPEIYLLASTQARLEVLQGLLDTDGSITKSGRVSFYNTNPQLVSAVEQLFHSLGLKSRTRWRKPAFGTLKSGHVINSQKMIAEVSCAAYAEHTLFKLPRKLNRLPLRENSRPGETLRRRIVSVTPTLSVPVRCINVESPSHLFLAGRGMIPTHNSEIQIRKSLAIVTRLRGTSLIFTLPTDPMFERMASSRIMPLVKDEKVFNLDSTSNDKPVRRKDMIQIGSSFLYVTGAKEGDATSIAADFVFNDEVDLTDQKMLALFSSRLQNSDYKVKQKFSTPTFVGFGIDAGYQGSDQHEYLCRCPKCGHWQAPTFSDKSVIIPGLSADTPLMELKQTHLDAPAVDLASGYFCCVKCRRALELGDVDNRQWVAKYPGRTNHRGYKVDPCSTDRLSVQYIITQMLEYSNLGFIRGWHNTVLGRPYTDANARLNDADIKLCFTGSQSVPPVDARAPTWLGIDMGLICHVIVGQGTVTNRMRVVQFLAVPVEALAETVQVILDTYNVIGGAVDRHPYTPTANALFEQSKGRILPVEYRGTKEVNFMETYGQANRTAMLDLVAKVVRLHQIQFSGYGDQELLITEHLKDMVRDEQPEQPATWVKLTGVDHYFHALAFLLVSLKFSELQMEEVDPRSAVCVVGVAPSTHQPSLLGANRK